MLLTRFAGMSCPQGERFETRIGRLFVTPVEAARKEDLPQWSPTLFKGDYRKRDNAEHVTCLASDVDEWQGTAHDFGEALTTALPDVHAAWHTTMSAEPDALRWRIAIGLKRTVGASEFLPLWRALAAVLARHGVGLDPSTKDVSKAYLWPATRPGGVWNAGVTGFGGLDTDAFIREGKRIIESERLAAVDTGPVRHADRYIAAAFERETEAIRTAGRGTRNATLSRAAFALGRLDVPADAITQALTAAATQAGLSKEESRATIRAALRARGKVAA